MVLSFLVVALVASVSAQSCSNTVTSTATVDGKSQVLYGQCTAVTVGATCAVVCPGSTV